MCDRFWAKWEFGNFSIFLWFSDHVGLWGISRSHDMYRAQKWSQQYLKMHSNDCCSCTKLLPKSVQCIYPATVLVKCTQIAPPHTWRWAKTTQNFEDALRQWQIKWINWGEVVEKPCHFILVTFYFRFKPKVCTLNFLTWTLKCSTIRDHNVHLISNKIVQAEKIAKNWKKIILFNHPWWFPPNFWQKKQNA